jgi:hypothetical protein
MNQSGRPNASPTTASPGKSPMSGKPLVIRVEEVGTGQAWTYLFAEGPVWVGSGAGASLPIERPFIFEQHGIFHFDDRAVRYQDLDPRGGTLLDGTPATRGEHPITEWTRLEMGPVRLTLSRQVPPEPISDPRLSPFAAAPLRTLVLPPRLDLPRVPAAAPQGWPYELPPGVPDEPEFRLSSVDMRVPIDDDDLPYRPRSESEARRGGEPRRPVRRRGRGVVRRAASRAFVWGSALALFLIVVGVAGLLLQYRGLPWMPPPLAARVPPWLSGLFH